jgi:hypothetical protein
MGGAGTQTAGLAIGGYAPSTAAVTTSTEEFGGSTWTAGGNLNTGRAAGGASGTQTAALFFGGDAPVTTGATEKYDGTSWTTNSAILGTARAAGGSANAAPQTAAAYFGGSYLTATEEFVVGALTVKTITTS